MHEKAHKMLIFYKLKICNITRTAFNPIVFSYLDKWLNKSITLWKCMSAIQLWFSDYLENIYFTSY